MFWSRIARVAAWVLPALPSVALSQNSECQSFGGREGNLCNAAVDGVRVFQPIVGQLLSGGNPELGRVGSLGGLGHFTVTLRVNVTRAVLPSGSYDGSTNFVPAGDRVTAPEPVVDVAVGLYRGLASGLLAIDFLGSMHIIPTQQGDIAIDPDATGVGSAALSFGAGFRLGLVGNEESPFAATMSLMWRALPTYSYTTGNYAFGSNLTATNARAILGWNKSMVSLGVGAGIDWYRGAGRASFNDSGLFVPQVVALDVSTRRFLAFADLGLQFPVVSMAFELGYQLGEDEGLVTEFAGHSPAQGLLFASVGIKFGI